MKERVSAAEGWFTLDEATPQLIGARGKASGSYFWDVATSLTNVNWDHNVSHAFEFDVPFSNPLGREFDFKQVDVARWVNIGQPGPRRATTMAPP